MAGKRKTRSTSFGRVVPTVDPDSIGRRHLGVLDPLVISYRYDAVPQGEEDLRRSMVKEALGLTVEQRADRAKELQSQD